jgi:hypothetical protein
MKLSISRLINTEADTSGPGDRYEGTQLSEGPKGQ